MPRVLPSRGLAVLRTLAGRADRRTPSYKDYLRISFLELERARHGQEIATARRRLEMMLARCREIEIEKAAILAAAGPPAAAGLPPGNAAARQPRRAVRFRY
jgi:hypothetical protein